VTSAETALEIRNLSKTFAGQRALDDVDVTVAAREIHALVGQNGSGKSTLIKVLAGYHQPDPGGTAAVRGRPLPLGSATAAHDSGIRFVHQDLGLILELSVLENLMVGCRYPTGFLGRIRWREAANMAGARLRNAGVELDVLAPVGSLGLAERTAVAIARALPQQGEKVLLVLDEPTASLPADDVERLFAILRRLRDLGNSIMIVTHHLDEVMRLADSVTVLRDGRKVVVTSTADVDTETLSRMIVGHALDTAPSRGSSSESIGPAMLRLEGLSGGTVVDVSADVGAGEILGIAGLTGSGREVIAAMVSGRVEHEGCVEVDGTAIAPCDPRRALRAGLASVPGERARYGTFANMTVRQNLTVGSLRRHLRRGHIDRRAERRETTDWIERFGIVTRGCDAPIVSLSGGNQQKVLVARAMRLGPKVLVLDDPTSGIDVKAREQVHRIIEASASEGTAVMLVSTDSDELSRLCDRVLVLGRGRIRAELRRGVDLTPERIDHAQVSVGPALAAPESTPR
jgi:ribose transport system ATP-binding protein